MSKNFYKEYLKHTTPTENSNKSEKIIIETPKLRIKLLNYIISFISSIFKILLFLFFIALISIGATVILNIIFKFNLMEVLNSL